VSFLTLRGTALPKAITKGGYPAVYFNEEDTSFFQDYVRAILNKKREKGRFNDRVSAEMGESAVDFLLEKWNKTRLWGRGRLHFDFCNVNGTIKLEVKTRKYYTPTFEDLDVRLDYKEFENAQESTHIVPVVYEELGVGSNIISPGAFLLVDFIAGCGRFKKKVPPTYSLREPCYRTTWELVFTHPKEFGFKPWDEFVKEF
jgi:hypothetical protein